MNIKWKIISEKPVGTRQVNSNYKVGSRKKRVPCFSVPGDMSGFTWVIRFKNIRKRIAKREVTQKLNSR